MNETEHPLRRWRIEHAVTLTDLAAHVGVTPSHLSEVERRINGISLPLADRLSKITGVPVKDFILRDMT
jgi:transcriptional regulator with XRE-family HTH domain